MKYSVVILGVLLLSVSSIAGSAFATTLDVYDWDVSKTDPVAQIETIANAQTGKEHYNYYSASGHPSGVDMSDYYNSNLWVHENTNTGEYTFGFTFGKDNGPNDPNLAELWFRIVDSTSDVYVSQSDDPNEAVEIDPGWFYGDYWYSKNTDGIAVSGVTGTDWTIIVDAVDFGDISSWTAAGGDGDLSLDLGHEYRITLGGNTPSGAPVNPTVPEPGTMFLLGFGLVGLVSLKRKKIFKK